MTFSIAGWTYSGNMYSAQPLGYTESDVQSGRTSRRMRLDALMTAADWRGLLGIYDTWRNARIQDPDSLVADDVGTTVKVSAAANGVTWTDVECWFLTAPTAEQVGAYLQVTVEVVDAAQALEVLKADQEKSEARYTFGTFTIGTTTVDLLSPPESFQDMPAMALTATGETYITGPSNATEIRNIEGETDKAGWDDICTWVANQVKSKPGSGSWFPVGAPTASAEARIVSGARSDVYVVSITLGKAI